VEAMKQRLIGIFAILLSLIVSLIVIIGLYRFWFWHQTWLLIDTLAVDISEPIQRTTRLVELNSETIVNASEKATLSPISDSNGVVEMIQASQDDSLLVVYSNGIFRRWDLNAMQSVAEFNFLAASPRGVNFSADGSLVITPGSVVTAAELNGYSVWDTRTGEVVVCEGPQCPEGWSHLKTALAGTGLTPNARWIIDYLDSYIHANGIQIRISGSWNIDSDPYDISDNTISRIAFDSTGSYIACATEEGRLLVFDIENLFNPTGRTNEDIIAGRGEGEGSLIKIKSRQYGSYQVDAHIITTDLVFDDTRTWLAQLTNQDLIVWDLRRVVFPRRMKISVEGGSVLAFNHAGNLLAVGTEKGIILFDLGGQKQIASFEVGEVTALYFSRDDRLLLWGDSDGAIHLWGTSQNP
jgi:WD40 repeat protein